jgi:hypothetical protein
VSYLLVVPVSVVPFVNMNESKYTRIKGVIYIL